MREKFPPGVPRREEIGVDVGAGLKGELPKGTSGSSDLMLMV